MMRMTPRELELAYKGYKAKNREQWEMVRHISFHSMIVHTKEGTLKIGDVFVPPDAENKTKKRLTSDMMMKVKKTDG